MNGRRTVVVAGHGMVGHRFVETLVERGATAEWDVVVFAEEPDLAYDRVALSSYFAGASAADLSLVAPGFFETPGLAVHAGDRVVAIDRAARTVRSAVGAVQPYDVLVLATGSYPFVPPIEGRDLTGCFVYRTLADLAAIKEYAGRCHRGAVVGGGLLGLEAANALRLLGLETHVVEFAPRLMPLQIDEGGGALLRRRIEELGVVVHTSCQTEAVVAGPDGSVAGMRFAGDGGDLDVDIVVFSAGIRPRDEMAREAGLDVGERGGVVVDEACRTSDPAVLAIGECALALGRTWGLVAPGYQMARVAADRLLGGTATFAGADLNAKLKLLGVDVASFGDAFGSGEGTEAVTFDDPVAKVYKRLVLADGGTRVVGGVLVGDASQYTVLEQMARGDLPTPAEPARLLLPEGVGGGPVTVGVEGLAATATVCSCNGVSKATICAAVADGGCTDTGAVKKATRAGSSCGGCAPLVTELVNAELRKAGVEVRAGICEHFAYSRQELFDLVRVHRIGSFAELLGRHGAGLGCEVCKPAVASILASLGAGYILDGEQASLQDTNDHFLANLQRDGTYSVVPRVPGGEITPDQLIAIGQVAKDFGLYSKITGGQRIDLFGARVDQLPAIWERLIEAGMESGHAYGKALRTVKSCVGQAWCRYGVQDSTRLAIQLELRYRGLRAPHKLKSAVSGCTRECAEAQSKDFGIIATERGWNLYVCGNGGMRPQHAVLLADDLDTESLIRYLDRFLMFYVRTADRLERTAPWFNKLEGGIDYLRSVVIDDALGIAAELEADMAAHVASYACEWKATLDDPVRLSRFRTFLNDGDDDGGGGGRWVEACAVEDLPLDRGACVLVGGHQVALFRTSPRGEVWALSNFDPFSRANVLSRGIVGSRGDVPKVASPMYKQSFDLRTGVCLDEPEVAVATYAVRVVGDAVEVAVP
ncbi:MAG: nitrite reductase large subunit [Actinomycetota bacterium]|jgi:nitrite reductase (NADH) large subunit|nr:nitrite reductase large subunit [Actinomycetota bacterium]